MPRYGEWLVVCDAGSPRIIHGDVIRYGYSHDGTHTDTNAAPRTMNARKLSNEFIVVVNSDGSEVIVNSYDQRSRVRCAWSVTKNDKPCVATGSVPLRDFKLPKRDSAAGPFPRHRTLMEQR